MPYISLFVKKKKKPFLYLVYLFYFILICLEYSSSSLLVFSGLYFLGRLCLLHEEIEKRISLSSRGRNNRKANTHRAIDKTLLPVQLNRHSVNHRRPDRIEEKAPRSQRSSPSSPFPNKKMSFDDTDKYSYVSLFSVGIETLALAVSHSAWGDGTAVVLQNGRPAHLLVLFFFSFLSLIFLGNYF